MLTSHTRRPLVRPRLLEDGRTLGEGLRDDLRAQPYDARRRAMQAAPDREDHADRDSGLGLSPAAASAHNLPG